MLAAGAAMVHLSLHTCLWSLMVAAVIFLSPCPPDPSQVLQVADALCAQLSSQDLLGNIDNNAAGEREKKHFVPSSSCQTSANPLLISC